MYQILNLCCCFKFNSTLFNRSQIKVLCYSTWNAAFQTRSRQLSCTHASQSWLKFSWLWRSLTWFENDLTTFHTVFYEFVIYWVLVLLILRWQFFFQKLIIIYVMFSFRVVNMEELNIPFISSIQKKHFKIVIWKQTWIWLYVFLWVFGSLEE